jgi:hypothetical protein
MVVVLVDFSPSFPSGHRGGCSDMQTTRSSLGVIPDILIDRLGGLCACIVIGTGIHGIHTIAVDSSTLRYCKRVIGYPRLPALNKFQYAAFRKTTNIRRRASHVARNYYVPGRSQLPPQLTKLDLQPRVNTTDSNNSDGGVRVLLSSLGYYLL